MGLSFRLAAVKGLRKKMKRTKVQGRAKRNIRRALFKTDSRPVAVAVAVPEFSEDVLMEILARLPANSLMRFKCVSRLWSSIISSRYFTNLFLKSPSPLRQSRRPFIYLVDKDHYALLSASPEKLDVMFYTIDQDLGIPGVEGCFVNALRGLMCFRIGGRRVRICNLTTKQCVELPLVRSSDDSNMWNHFGYDPVQDEYKVLSLVWEVSKEERVVRSEHQVLVLGPGASWRRITQTVLPHRPYSQGISINYVLYYGALTGENTSLVVSFDMRSEEFILIELPLEVAIIWDTIATNLMNYQGKIAVFDYSRVTSEGYMDLWVVEDAGKSQWSNKKNIFVLPVFHIYILTDGELWMHGTSREGEIRFYAKNRNSMHTLLDLKSSKAGGFVLSTLHYNSFETTKSSHMNYWDDSESIMYLEV